MASTAPPELESPWADLSLGDICPAVDLLGASESCGHYLALHPGQTGLVSGPRLMETEQQEPGATGHHGSGAAQAPPVQVRGPLGGGAACTRWLVLPEDRQFPFCLRQCVAGAGNPEFDLPLCSQRPREAKTEVNLVLGPSGEYRDRELNS